MGYLISLANGATSTYKKNSLVFSNFLSEHVNKIKEEKIKPGTFIFREDTPGDRFYLILDGAANVFRNGKLIAKLIEGNYFGDVALINDQLHQVSIEAGNNLKVVSIDGNDFMQLYESSEAVKKYIQSMHGFNRNKQGIIYSQFESHYKNQNSLTTILTFPNGASCSIIKVVGTCNSLKITKQVEEIEVDGKVIAKRDVELRPQDILQSPTREKESPIFYLRKNRLIGAEINAAYANLDHIVPAIIERELIGPFRRALYKTKGDLWIKSVDDDPTDSAIICSCMGITRGELKKKVMLGCDNAEQLTRETGASLACGFCAQNVADIASSAKMVTADFLLESTAESYCNKTQTIKCFRFKPKKGVIEDYLPGQHIRLEADIDGHRIQRSYTLTSDANQKEYYEIAVRRTKKGVFSNWLHDQLSHHSCITISKPQGQFHLDCDTKNPIVCFVAGVGVTPAIAILRYLISVNHKSPVYIDYSVSSYDDCAFSSQFSSIKTDWFNFNLRVTERRQRSDVTYNGIERRKISGKNRVSQKHINKVAEDYSNADYYICGGKPYEETVISCLLNYGVKAEKIHSEQFDNTQKGATALLVASVLILCLTLLFFIVPSYTPPNSVNTLNPPRIWLDFAMAWDNFDQVRQNHFPSDITGYSILGLGILGLLMSLPRRWAWVRVFNLDLLRLVHVGSGVFALLLLFLHTGFAMGGLHTILLSSCFLGLFILGSLTGITIALQQKLSPARTYPYKKWFKRLHIAVSWPLPILLGAHILSTYWF